MSFFIRFYAQDDFDSDDEEEKSGSEVEKN